MKLTTATTFESSKVLRTLAWWHALHTFWCRRLRQWLWSLTTIAWQWRRLHAIRRWVTTLAGIIIDFNFHFNLWNRWIRCMSSRASSTSRRIWFWWKIWDIHCRLATTCLWLAASTIRWSFWWVWWWWNIRNNHFRWAIASLWSAARSTCWRVWRWCRSAARAIFGFLWLAACAFCHVSARTLAWLWWCFQTCTEKNGVFIIKNVEIRQMIDDN